MSIPVNIPSSAPRSSVPSLPQLDPKAFHGLAGDIAHTFVPHSEANPIATPVKELGDLPAILTVRQVQSVLGVSRAMSYKLIHAEGFPLIKLGRALRVRKDDFLRWLAAQAGR
jgi:excisionase family DNA binding protein